MSKPKTNSYLAVKNLISSHRQLQERELSTAKLISSEVTTSAVKILLKLLRTLP